MSINEIPWTVGLELGMGLNSFTQAITRDKAVTITTDSPGSGAHDDKVSNSDDGFTSINVKPDDGDSDGVSQQVMYSHSQINSQSDMAKALNISAALAIQAGGVQASGAGSFINQEKVNSADINFLLRCVVRNHYNVKQRRKFNWEGIPKHSTFLETYGDSFIYQLVEGGEFVAVVSIKTSDSSSTMKIAAELQVAFSVVSGKGAGGYDLSTVKSLSNTTVTVNYSGAAGVNQEGKDWNIDLMLKEAAGFPQKCLKARSPISALTMKYTALSDFAQLNLDSGPPSFDKANIMAADMFNDSQALKQLLAHITQTIGRLQSGQLVASQLTLATGKEPFDASLDGFTAAKAEVGRSISTIQLNATSLATNPPSPADSAAKSPLAKYATADDLRARLPSEPSTAAATTLGPMVGTALAAVHFVDANAVHHMYLFWQQCDGSIVRATFAQTNNNNNSWAAGLTTVVPAAAANTPIAASVGPDGADSRVFYLDSSGHAADMVLQAGDSKYTDGGLSGSPVGTVTAPSTRLAAVRWPDGSVQLFFQGNADPATPGLVRSATLAAAGKWALTADALPAAATGALGCGLAAATSKVTSGGATKDVLSLFFQDSKDGALVELTYDPAAAADKWTLTPTQVFPSPLPIGTGMCAFPDGGSLAVAAISRSNAVITSTRDTAQPTWAAPKTVCTDGTRSPGLAAQAWSGNDGPVKKVLLQVQNLDGGGGGGLVDLHEVSWDAPSGAWAARAVALAVGKA